MSHFGRYKNRLNSNETEYRQWYIYARVHKTTSSLQMYTMKFWANVTKKFES